MKDIEEVDFDYPQGVKSNLKFYVKTYSQRTDIFFNFLIFQNINQLRQYAYTKTKYISIILIFQCQNAILQNRKIAQQLFRAGSVKFFSLTFLRFFPDITLKQYLIQEKYFAHSYATLHLFLPFFALSTPNLNKKHSCNQKQIASIISFKRICSTHSLQYYQTIKFKSKEMGTIQSKIKEGYRMQLAPLFQSEVNRGLKPELQEEIFNYSNQQQTQTSELTEFHEETEFSIHHNPSTKKLQTNLSKIKSNCLTYPYSTVGLIKSNIDGLEVYGTGTIIGKRHVLTCAHNCYSIKNSKPTENIQFFPAYSASRHGPCYKPKIVYLSPSFQNSLMDGSSIESTIANDYAVIELATDDNLEATYGSLGIDFSEDFSQKEKQIIGYSKKHHRHSHLYCYKTEGHLQSGIIKYDMPASAGMGGSPIIEERENNYFIVGLHVYCLHVGHTKQRGGLKMGRRVLENMQKWMCQEVETVDLRQRDLEKEGLKYISKHNWKKLASLTLVKCNLFSNASKYLRKGNWGHLVHLDLGGNNFGKEGMQQFSQGDFKSLKSLSLWGNGICKGGAYYLTLARLDSLESLNLYHNELGNDGLENICKGKWTHLIALHIGNNLITFQSLSHLENTCWTRLESVNLWGNKLESEESIIKTHFKYNFKQFKSLTI